MVRKALGLSAILAVFWLSLPIFCPASSVDRYLHKNAQIDSPPQNLFHGSAMKPIPPLEAASFALHRLEARGVRDIVICEISWIAAAISGYLVDAKGKATINGINYSTFRIGIRDGLEKKNGKFLAGDEFVFIARGEKESGQSAWYPSPGPDYKMADGDDVTEGMLAYEFLLNREKFESLGRRFP